MAAHQALAVLDELEAYAEGRMTRRAFVRQLVAAGVSLSAAMTYATVLAIARKEIPACHYMMAAFGGTTIRCAGYARYGTKELSDFALQALEGLRKHFVARTVDLTLPARE